MAKKNSQEAFKEVAARILEDISQNLENLQKSDSALSKSLFGLASATPPEAQVQSDAGMPVNSVFNVLSLGKGESLAKIGTMSHMMATQTKPNKRPVRILPGNRSPKPAAPAQSIPALIGKGKKGAPKANNKQSKAAIVAQNNPKPAPQWAQTLGVTPQAPSQDKSARTKGIPSQLKMSHGNYQIQANPDGSSSLLYTKKHTNPIMNLIFGGKPKDLGRFAHRAEAYNSLLGHHDQMAAGLIKDEETSGESSPVEQSASSSVEVSDNSEISPKSDPDSHHDLEPKISRAAGNVPSQDSAKGIKVLKAPGSGGIDEKKKAHKLKKDDSTGVVAAPKAPAAITTTHISGTKLSAPKPPTVGAPNLKITPQPAKPEGMAAPEQNVTDMNVGGMGVPAQIKAPAIKPVVNTIPLTNVAPAAPQPATQTLLSNPFMKAEDEHESTCTTCNRPVKGSGSDVKHPQCWEKDVKSESKGKSKARKQFVKEKGLNKGWPSSGEEFTKAVEPLEKPPVSQAQRAAMAAAAHGKSTLDIPKSVGKEFIAEDPGGKLPAHKTEMPAGPVQGAGAVTGDNAMDKTELAKAGPRLGAHDATSQMMTQHAMGAASAAAKNAKMPPQQQAKPLASELANPVGAALDRGPAKASADLNWMTGVGQTPTPTLPGLQPGSMPVTPAPALPKITASPAQSLGLARAELLKDAEDLGKQFKAKKGCKVCGSMKKGCH